MHVVVVDAGVIAGEANFPQLNLKKFGWSQYPSIDVAEMDERCWRSDVIVSSSTIIDQALIDKAFKLKLIVIMGEPYGHIDLAATNARGITVCNTPGLDPANVDDAKKPFPQMVNTLNGLLEGDLG